jgi:hypothetical protein
VIVQSCYRINGSANNDMHQVKTSLLSFHDASISKSLLVVSEFHSPRVDHVDDFSRKQLCFPCWCFLFPPTKDPFSVKEVALRLLVVRIISQLKLKFWQSRLSFGLNKCYSLIFKYHPKMVTREMLPDGRTLCYTQPLSFCPGRSNRFGFVKGVM